MKKKIKPWKFLFILPLILIWFLIFPIKIPHSGIPQICYKNNCYNLEIANTPELREKWLMNREILQEESGMIFIFEKDDIHKFWMKDTLIPLDMIWLSSWFQVIYIANAIPCKQEICPIYSPDKLAKYVLEVSAGQAAKLWLKIWNQMQKRWLR